MCWLGIKQTMIELGTVALTGVPINRDNHISCLWFHIGLCPCKSADLIVWNEACPTVAHSWWHAQQCQVGLRSANRPLSDTLYRGLGAWTVHINWENSEIKLLKFCKHLRVRGPVHFAYTNRCCKMVRLITPCSRVHFATMPCVTTRADTQWLFMHLQQCTATTW